MKTYKQILEARKVPPKGSLDKAVKAMQLYLGSLDKTTIRDQQRFKVRIDKFVDKIVKSTGNDDKNVWDQLEAEAKKRGVITPTPGKDF